MVDSNKKLPKHAWDDEEIVPKKGFTTGWQDILGNREITYASPSEPEKFSYQRGWASGSYQTLQFDNDKKEIITDFTPGEQRQYVAGGKSSHSDGHLDVNSESTIKHNSAGDFGVSYKTGYETATQGKVAAYREYKKEFITSASESKSFSGSYGDQVNEHSGNWHEAFEKDHVQGVTGNKIVMVKGGDYALHVQSGNYDAHIASKGRIFSASDLLIESSAKITIKVGGSTITMTSGGIVIKADRIDLNP